MAIPFLQFSSKKQASDWCHGGVVIVYVYLLWGQPARGLRFWGILGYNGIAATLNHRSLQNFLSEPLSNITFLIVNPLSAINFEIVSLSLPEIAEIWQSWYAIFGNPEIQILVSGFFYYVYAKSRVDFNFQGCHLFSNILILCLYGNPELKFSFSPCMNLKLLNYMLFIQNLFKKPKIYFYSST